MTQIWKRKSRSNEGCKRPKCIQIHTVQDKPICQSNKPNQTWSEEMKIRINLNYEASLSNSKQNFKDLFKAFLSKKILMTIHKYSLPWSIFLYTPFRIAF